MRAKTTIWTVAAGTTAAVLIPGVAYAMVGGGESAPRTVEDAVVQPADGAAQASVASAPPASSPVEPAAALPATETMQSAGTAGGEVSAVTAVSAPTSDRTIEWQNASARRWTSMTPSPRRDARSSRSSRMVVAPSRGRQNAAKLRSPTRVAADALRVSRSRR